jgi:hypothetical protein
MNSKFKGPEQKVGVRIPSKIKDQVKQPGKTAPGGGMPKQGMNPPMGPPMMPQFNQPPGLQPPGGAMPKPMGPMPMGPMPGMGMPPPPRMAPFSSPGVGTRYPGGGNRMF